MWTVVAAVSISGFLGIFTDWLFMGLVFHDAYSTHPEVWRQRGERGAIVWAGALGLVMSAAVVALCAATAVTTVWGGLGVALLAWLAGPLVVVVINGLFVKIDARITIVHCLGYLVRMAIAGAAAGLLLPLS